VRRALLALLGIDALLAWVEVVGIATFLQRVWLTLGQRDLRLATLEAHWAQVEAARRLHGLAWLATAVVFLVWLHRSWRLLHEAGLPDLSFTPRGAVVAFLVPGLNLLVPCRAVRDLWRASDPARRAGTAPSGAGAPPLLVWWWVVFVVATLLDPVVFRLSAGAEWRLGLGQPTVIVVLAQLVEIAAAVLAITVVGQIGRRQGALFGPMRP
jgi:hypothetical protein